MGLFSKIIDYFRTPNINLEYERFQAIPDAVLLDVREAEEYAARHLPGSQNLPLSALTKESAAALIRYPDTPVFVYCLAGPRSKRAKAALKSFGYVNINEMGGIRDYQGPVESGASDR